MNLSKVSTVSSRIYIGFCALSLAYLSLMSLVNPQATMKLVEVELLNTDALSSIRGIYGGVGLTMVSTLIYLLWKDLQKGLIFLTLFWGFYAISRVITLLVDGPLGDFGSQWLLLESVFCVLAIGLFAVRKQTVSA